jgi:hypothetical protein
MGFLKNLFGKSEPFVPAPTQSIPGLDPIVVQAIENLYPNQDDQKLVFDHSLRFNERFKYHPVHGRDNISLLAFLKMSEGSTEKFIELMNLPYLDNYQIWNDMIRPVFPNRKAAEQWVQSITKSAE